MKCPVCNTEPHACDDGMRCACNGWTLAEQALPPTEVEVLCIGPQAETTVAMLHGDGEWSADFDASYGWAPIWWRELPDPPNVKGGKGARVYSRLANYLADRSEKLDRSTAGARADLIVAGHSVLCAEFGDATCPVCHPRLR